jgi:hypothetical protein
MDSETFRSKLHKLAQKSRKALHLYASIGGSGDRHTAQLSDLQLQEWKLVNQELAKRISELLENSAPRSLIAEVFLLRDRFYLLYRESERDTHLKQKSLMNSATNGDFLRAALLSRELVILKARLEAANAAHQELKLLLVGCKLDKPPSSTAEPILVQTSEVKEEAQMPVDQSVGKVIPLRKRI